MGQTFCACSDALVELESPSLEFRDEKRSEAVSGFRGKTGRAWEVGWCSGNSHVPVVASRGLPALAVRGSGVTKPDERR